MSTNTNDTTPANDFIKAMSTMTEAVAKLPQLEQQLSDLELKYQRECDWADTISKQRAELEAKFTEAQAKIARLEVERDDYGFRNLELTERMEKLGSLAGALLAAVKPIDAGLSVNPASATTQAAPTSVDPSATTAYSTGVDASSNGAERASGESVGTVASVDTHSAGIASNTETASVDGNHSPPSAEGQSDVGERGGQSSAGGQPDMDGRTGTDTGSKPEPATEVSYTSHSPAPQPYSGHAWWSKPTALPWSEFVAGGGQPSPHEALNDEGHNAF